MLTPAFHYDTLKPYVVLMADSMQVMLISPCLSLLHTQYSTHSHQFHSQSCVPQTAIDTATCNNTLRTNGRSWSARITPLEVSEHISLMTLDIMMKCAFSHQGSIQLDRNSQSYIQVIGDLNNLIFSHLRNPFHHNDTFYSLTPDGCWNHNACQLTHQHTGSLRKAHLQEEGKLEKVRRKRHLDFLDILLLAKVENGSSLSNKDLRAEVDTFMFEGHNTTASGISWILYALATHPKHQQRCREEIQGLLGDGASITWYHSRAFHLWPSPQPKGVAKPRALGILSPPGWEAGAGPLPVLALMQLFDPSCFASGSARHSHAFLPFSGGSSFTGLVSLLCQPLSM
ncbi:hypothetical protein H8959_005702 [Pygathrix nigripes]